MLNRRSSVSLFANLTRGIKWGAFTLTALLMVIVPASAQAQDGTQLFRKMQRALGGTDKIDAVRDFDQCVRADAWDNSGKYYGVVYKRTRWIKPNILRLDQTGPGNSYVVYFDGASGWEILPDKGYIALEGDELAYARGYLNGIDLKSWQADRDAANTFSILAPNVVAVSNKDDSSHRTEIKLDPATFLPAKETQVSLDSPKSPVATRARAFHGWVTAAGVKFPQRIINFHGEQRVADIHLQGIKVNDALKAWDLSARPDSLKPVMANCGR